MFALNLIKFSLMLKLNVNLFCYGRTINVVPLYYSVHDSLQNPHRRATLYPNENHTLKVKIINYSYMYIFKVSRHRRKNFDP